MVIKLSLELGVLVESSQEKDVQNPRQKGKVKGRGRGPRQFGEACMTFFHVAGAVGDRDTTCHCSTTLGERSDVFFPSQNRAMILGFDMFLIGHLEWEQPQEWGTYNHHSTGISMVLGKWIS